MSRRELYDKVWNEPIVRLSKQYGISDVWLAKICKKNRIPRPPRGYWAQRQSGKKIPRTPLPKGDDGRIIEISVKERSSEKDEILFKEISSAKKILKTTVVPGFETDPHPLIKKSRNILKSVKPEPSGLLLPSQEDCLDIKVSGDSLSRALQIMDTLIKILIALGAEISLTGKSTEVRIGDVSLGMTIREKLYRRRLKAEDHNLDGYYQFGYCLFEEKATPTGKLFLSINDTGFYNQHRKIWRDTDLNKLEDCLKGVASGLIKIAVSKKAHMLKKKNSTNI